MTSSCEASSASLVSRGKHCQVIRRHKVRTRARNRTSWNMANQPSSGTMKSARDSSISVIEAVERRLWVTGGAMIERGASCSWKCSETKMKHIKLLKTWKVSIAYPSGAALAIWRFRQIGRFRFHGFLSRHICCGHTLRLVRQRMLNFGQILLTERNQSTARTINGSSTRIVA